jgi:hypothetical protein
LDPRSTAGFDAGAFTFERREHAELLVICSATSAFWCTPRSTRMMSMTNGARTPSW